MKLAKTLKTALGAGALTVVAAGTALAVNIGIMSQQVDPGAGTLGALSATSATAQVSPQYVYIDLTNPSQVVNPADQASQPQATAAPTSNLISQNGQHEGAEYDD